MSVLGHPSVLYLRLSQPSSRYQPSRPCSAIFASTSSSVYVLGFSSVAMGNRLLEEHYITTPPLTLIACPVMNDASGEARYSAAAATSPPPSAGTRRRPAARTRSRSSPGRGR